MLALLIWSTTPGHPFKLQLAIEVQNQMGWPPELESFICAFTFCKYILISSYPEVVYFTIFCVIFWWNENSSIVT